MLVILFGCLAVISGCAVAQTNWDVSPQIRAVKFDESFKMQSDETVQTEDGKLVIQLKAVGRTISESSETEYVELQIRSNKSEQTVVINERGSRLKIVGSYVIKLVNAESFGKANCELKVSRKDQPDENPVR